MDQILYIRETILIFYKKYEVVLNFLLKLILGIIIFDAIGGLGFQNADLKKNLPRIPLLPPSLLFGAAFAALPVTPAYLLVIIYIAYQTSAVLEIALVITLVLICVLVFYIRLAPVQSILIVLTMLAFRFNIPYFAPMFAGLYFGLTGIVPVTLGVFAWHSIPILTSLLSSAKVTGFDLVEILPSFSALYIDILNGFGANSQWMFIAFIFVMVVIIVHVISRLSMDYSKEISIALGATVTIVSFIIAVLITEMNISIFGIIFFTLLSAAILFVFLFFDCFLDYSRAERVEFEDDENYYFVKIVPKYFLIRRNRVVKRIRPTPEDFDDYM